MSSTFKPKKYVAWRPNKSFVKFFEDMRSRKITNTSDAPVMRVTDTSLPSMSKVSQSLAVREKQKSTRNKLVSFALDKKRKSTPSSSSSSGPLRPNKKKSAQHKSAQGLRDKGKKTSLEKRIRDHKFL